MKRIYITLMVLALLTVNTLKAQVIAGWDFNSNQDKSSSINATTNHSNLETYSLSRGDNTSYVDISYGYFIRAKAKSTTGNTKADGLAKKDYFLVNLKAATGYKLSLSKIAFKLRGSTTAGNSPNTYRWSYSINGTDFFEIGTSDVSFTSTDNVGQLQPDIDLSAITNLQNLPATTTVTLRLLAWGAGSSAASDIGIGRNTSGVTANVLAVEGSLLSTLPVELTSFTAKPQANAVQLNWQTASEQRNSHFEILRSADGSSFDVIGRKEGHGTTQIKQTYSFVDKQPVNGTSYYALKQYDEDGVSKLYDAIPVKISLTSSWFSVAPSAAGISIRVEANLSEKANVSIIDISGNKIVERQLLLNKGTNQLEIDNVTLTKGKLYLVSLKSANISQTAKLIK